MVFGLGNLKKKANVGTPLFNIQIKLDGWQGPFEHFDYFLDIAKIAEECANLRGTHCITSEGKIINRRLKGLHLFEAEMNFTQMTRPHVYYAFRGQTKRIYFINLEKIDIKNSDLPDNPIYTLGGLYNSIPKGYPNAPIKYGGESTDSKIEVLAKEFPSEFRILQSSSKEKEGILKSLEEKYRREISNQ
jgi:hypothetical protein